MVNESLEFHFPNLPLMILYNVTIKVDPAINDEWLVWMKQVHIPEVMNTGLFTEYRINRILELDESEGVTYAIQYLCNNLSDYETYRDEFAPALQQAHQDKYKDRFFAFRTIMEVIG